MIHQNVTLRIADIADDRCCHSYTAKELKCGLDLAQTLAQKLIADRLLGQVTRSTANEVEVRPVADPRPFAFSGVHGYVVALHYQGQFPLAAYHRRHLVR